ncbi:MAG: ABC transporter permease [Sphaerochaetaceae bacterium]
MNSSNTRTRIGRFFQANMPWVILLILSLVFSTFAPKFFTLKNIINILNQNAYLVVCAIGVTFVMMAGNLDLSVGYQMSLVGILVGKLFQAGAPAWLLIIAGIVIGVVLSEINMLLALKLKISLLMATVGTMTIYQGLSYTISKSRNISGFTDGFRYISKGAWGIIPFAVILAVVLVVVMSLFLSKTYWGRFVYAIGGNEEAARLSGINVTGVKLMIGGIAGAFVGLSALMLVARVGTAQSGVGPGTEMTVITAILIGGVSIRGGEGRISGVVAGILILAILSNGMQLAGWDVNSQFIVKGIIMLASIGFDVFQMSRRKIEVDDTAKA